MVVALCVAAPAWADRSTDELAAYARARAADGDGQVALAAAGYATALAGAPGDVEVARRAYREGLKAGDEALVDRAILALDASHAAPPDAALLQYAGAVRSGDKVAASAALKRIADGPFDFVAGLLSAWATYDAGGDALARLGEARRNPVASRYTAENRALLLIATDHVDEGAVALQALLGVNQASLDLRINAAQLLAARGRPDIARAVLSGSDNILIALRQSLGNGVSPSSAFGASRLFTRLAADLSEGDPTPIVIALSRAALRLEPGNDRARLLLAQALAQDGASERALAALDQIPPDSPFREAALQARVAVLDGAGQTAQAIAAATALSERKGADSADAARLAALLVAAGRFDEASRFYALAIKRAGDVADWTLYLQLGSALDAAGHWPEARAALERAVAMAPDAPVALNYLGYSRLEHGEDLPGSISLLEKAHSLRPDDASILDSLAWAYFLRGETARAVPMLERAVREQPANATINEHLGDAYWSLGRHYEARYAWRAASVVADAEETTRLTRKIADGIGLP